MNSFRLTTCHTGETHAQIIWKWDKFEICKNLIHSSMEAKYSKFIKKKIPFVQSDSKALWNVLCVCCYRILRAQKLYTEAYSGGGGYGDQWNLLISGGFQASTGAEPPPPGKRRNFSPLDNLLNTPLNVYQSCVLGITNPCMYNNKSQKWAKFRLL